MNAQEGNRQTKGRSAGPARIIARLLRITWRYPGRCVAVLAIQLGQVVLGLAALNLTGVGIDFVHHRVDPAAGPPVWPFGLVPSPDWSALHVVTALGIGVLAMALARTVLNYHYYVQVGVLLQKKIVVELRARVFEKLQNLSFRFYDAHPTGSIINRVTSDVQSTRTFIDGVMFQGIIMILSMAVYVVYMVRIHAALALACMATTPLLWILTASFSRRTRPGYLKRRELSDNLVRTLSETVQGIHVVKAFAREKERIDIFDRANDRLAERSYWIFHQVGVFTPSVHFVAQVNLVVLVLYGGFLVHSGDLPIGTGLVVFAGLLQQFALQLATLATIANNAQESVTAAGRVFEIIDAPVEVASPAEPVPLRDVQGQVEFRDVSFAFTPDDPVLRDLSFTVQPGQCVAVLGATGAGKTALLNLIARFYDPTAGEVRLDGRDLREHDLDDLRRNIGIVFQENFLFSSSVHDNIAFGHPEATREQVVAAAKTAMAHDFICEMADGYDTLIGEGGNDLSGGQRQRLTIARAVLLEPAVLLLDDPTAAIDPETERGIMASMDNAMRGRTTFVVAHRLSTLRRAQFIVVLDRGRIVERGTHDRLMKLNGVYSRVAMLQVIDDESRRLLAISDTPRATS